MNKLEDFMTVTEAGKKLGLTSQRVSTFCRQGRLNGAKKIGHYWIIPRESVERFKRQPPGLKPKNKTKEQSIDFIIGKLKELKKANENDK